METNNTKIEYTDKKRSYMKRDLAILVIIASLAAIIFMMGLSYFMLISFIVDFLVIALIIALLSLILNENLFRVIIFHIKRK